MFPTSAASELLATPTADITLLVVAAGSGARPDETSDLVWFVQRGAASGEQRTELAAFPLGFVLAERGTLVVFDANGTHITELGPGQAILLPVGTRGSFGSANGDLVLYVQIALVPVAVVPETLPRGTLVSKSFTAPSGDTISLEPVRGILNPTRAAEMPASATPALLLATDSAIQLETATGDVIDLPSGELFLLAEPATVHNHGHQPATFVIARSALAGHATPHLWSRQVSIQCWTTPGTATGATSTLETHPA